MHYLTAVLYLCSFGIAFCQPLSLFVAVDGGSDVTGDGTMGNPFQSISAAQLYIRNNVTKSAYSDIFVEIREGLYFLSAPLAFTAQDSGTTTTHITYRAYNGEDVRLIAGASIGGWASVTDSAILGRLREPAKSKVIVASLGSFDPGVLVRRGFGAGSAPSAMELFFKTQPMIMARYPNDKFLTVFGYANISGASTVSFDSQTNNLANWQQETDPWAFGYWYHDWADDSISIKQLTSLGGSNVSFVANSQNTYGFKVDQRFYLQNFLSELDMPGEYYIDRTNLKIYFWPPSTDYTQNDFIVSLNDNVITLTDISYFTLDGFTIEATRKDGISGNRLRNVTLSNLVVRNTGMSGMTLIGPENIVVEGCLVDGPGNAGIKLNGGTRANLTRSNHVARNNIVRNFSRFVKTYQPAFQVDGVGITIENNEMYNAPHTALLWSGNYHTLQYNIVHDVCTETGDVGAFYSGRDWTRRGTVIKHNLFYNINGPGLYGASGVYLDDQYSSATVFGNIFYNVYRGVLLGGGRDNDIFNNVFIGSQYAISTDARGLGICGPMGNATLMVNLFATPFQSDLWRDAFPTLYTILENEPNAPKGNRIGTNIYVNCTRNNYFCGNFNYSAYIDVLESCFNLTMQDFSDLTSLDFHLQSDAIASKCGSSFASTFAQIPLENIGVVTPNGNAPNANSPNNPNNNSPSNIASATSHVIYSSAVFLLVALAHLV